YGWRPGDARRVLHPRLGGRAHGHNVARALHAADTDWVLRRTSAPGHSWVVGTIEDGSRWGPVLFSGFRQPTRNSFRCDQLPWVSKSYRVDNADNAAQDRRA